MSAARVNSSPSGGSRWDWGEGEHGGGKGGRWAAQGGDEEVESRRLVNGWMKEVRDREELSTRARCEFLAGKVAVSSPNEEPPGKIEDRGEVQRSFWDWGPGRWLARWLGPSREEWGGRLRFGGHQHSLVACGGAQETEAGPLGRGKRGPWAGPKLHRRVRREEKEGPQDAQGARQEGGRPGEHG